MGSFSSLACVALLVDMLVAIVTTKRFAMPKGPSPLSWLDGFLYVPEVLYRLGALNQTDAPLETWLLRG
jgi:putative oxidoreductase